MNGMNEMLIEMYRDFLPDHTLDYDGEKRIYFEKLLLDFSKIEECQLQMLHDKDGDRLAVKANDKISNPNFLVDCFVTSVSTLDTSEDYVSEMTSELQSMYQLFQKSRDYVGNFGIGLQNTSSTQKYVIKTDIPEMLVTLERSGYIVKENKATLRVSKNDYQELEIEKASEEKLEENSVLPTELSENSEEKVTHRDAEVDFYERLVKNEMGNNVVVKLSVVKQDSEDSEYARLVNVSYMNKESGLLETKDVFGYQDAHEFDNNALPALIDGFQKTSEASGSSISFSSGDDVNCSLSSENGNSLSFLGYPVDYIHSIVQKDKAYNLVGDENRQVDLQELKQENVVGQANQENSFSEKTTDFVQDSIASSMTTTNAITTNPVAESNPFENSLTVDTSIEKEQGVVLQKKLGTMPNPVRESEAGLTSYLGLIFFFLVDVVAIAVGVYLLMH